MQIQDMPIEEIKPSPRNARSHPEKQVEKIAKSIKQLGFRNPVLIDTDNVVIAGHGRLLAARHLGMTKLPVIVISDLNEPQKRALRIADNKVAEDAGWNLEVLRIELKELSELEFDVELSGFSTGEVDLIIDGETSSRGTVSDDEIAMPPHEGAPVSCSGDVWELGPHRLLCGSALHHRSYEQVLQDEKAQLIIADPPFNVKINGHVKGRGKTHHREFLMGSGEMSKAGFTNFLATTVDFLIQFSRSGSIHFLFIDWRHLPEMLHAALPAYHEWKNLLVWNKENAGQGTFFRSKHELILAFKNGSATHINNFGLGEMGRYRANVLDYPGTKGLHSASQGELDLHPTRKPVALIADLIRDCSRRKGIILDPFCGSGTIIIAAERTGRIARAIELDHCLSMLRYNAGRSYQINPRSIKEPGLALKSTQLNARESRDPNDARYSWHWVNPKT